jgi:hypothetical protein
LHSPDEPQDQMPPWEMPGAVRRDCESHHGTEFALAGRIVLTFAILSFFACFTPLSLVVFPACILIWRLMRRELRLMDRGMVDPEGRRKIEIADHEALQGLLLSGVTCMITTALLWRFIFP